MLEQVAQGGCGHMMTRFVLQHIGRLLCCCLCTQVSSFQYMEMDRPFCVVSPATLLINKNILSSLRRGKSSDLCCVALGSFKGR